MVNVVKKGANRASANAKRTKHAQRTPLPAKAPKADDDATALSMPTANSLSAEKAFDFVKHAKDAGWQVDLQPKDDEVVEVIAKRDTEAITIRWRNGVFIDDAIYSCGSYQRKVRNASAGKQFMARKAQDAIAESMKARANTPRKRSVADDEAEMDERTRKSLLPFDVETSTDEEVIAALIGKTIVWRNRTTGQNEQAALMDKFPQQHLTIVWKHNRRVLNFLEDHGMFRSVYVDAIRRVL